MAPVPESQLDIPTLRTEIPRQAQQQEQHPLARTQALDSAWSFGELGTISQPIGIVIALLLFVLLAIITGLVVLHCHKRHSATATTPCAQSQPEYQCNSRNWDTIKSRRRLSSWLQLSTPQPARPSKAEHRRSKIHFKIQRSRSGSSNGSNTCGDSCSGRRDGSGCASNGSNGSGGLHVVHPMSVLGAQWYNLHAEQLWADDKLRMQESKRYRDQLEAWQQVRDDRNEVQRKRSQSNSVSTNDTAY